MTTNKNGLHKVKQFAIQSGVLVDAIKSIPKHKVPLVEMFYGIEGEGSEIGERRILLRLGGCLVKCTGCDSVHTWNANKAQLRTLNSVFKDLAALIKESNVHTVAVTGGEPTHYPEQLKQIASFLREQHVRSWLETSGYTFSEDLLLWDFVSFDIKTPSSGVAAFTSQDVDSFFEQLSLLINKSKSRLNAFNWQVKAIVKDEQDIEFLLQNVPFDFPLIITPSCDRPLSVENIHQRMLLCMDKCKQTNWKIIAQQHALLSMR